MKYLLSIALTLLSSSLLANGLDSLTLTDTEIKKLKMFFPTEEENHLRWQGDPIQINLPIGKEKRLVFSSPITVNIKSALNTNQLRVLNINKSLYLTASQAFPSTRIFVTYKESGEVLLIDLCANKNASAETIYIDSQAHNQKDQTINSNSTTQTISNPSNNDTSYVDLMRFAWQQSYAPGRLLKEALQFPRALMHTHQFVSDLVYGDKVITVPLGSWTSGKYYVTAVLLRNKYAHKTQINVHKDFCGNWQAAILYPRSILQPYGKKDKDSTSLFLISTRPFGETLGVCNGNA